MTSKIPMTNSSGNGYCKMGDGTLIQWGEFSSQGVWSQGETFAIPYVSPPTVIPSVMAQTLGINATSVAVTTTNFLVGFPDSGIAKTITWIAIGRWK